MVAQKLKLTDQSLAQFFEGPSFLVDFRHFVNLDDLVSERFPSCGSVHLFVDFVVVLLKQSQKSSFLKLEGSFENVFKYNCIRNWFLLKFVCNIQI